MSRRFADLPIASLPRERALVDGVRALKDGELLALLLRSGTAGANAADLADEVMIAFGSLGRVSSATIEELSAVKGIGPAKATSVVAAFELARRAMAPSDTRVVRHADDVADIAGQLLRNLQRERVIAIICDRRGRVLRTTTVSDGAADRAMFPVREILNAVLRHDGGAFAIAHNHPSCDATPSESDHAATAAIAAGARTVGLRFLGHVIVSRESWSEVSLTPSQRTPG